MIRTKEQGMLHRLSRKHRFPKKRNIPKTALLYALPVVLVILLMVGSVLVNRDSSGSVAMPEQQTTLPVELPRKEAYPTGSLSASLQFDKLLVEKSKHRLTAFAKGKPVRVYLVALGQNPVGRKQIQGDKRTPEGLYTINGKNPKSAYYKNLGISYPSDGDRAHAKSLKRTPGGDIKIHGLAPEFADIGPAHRLTDWTLGCIAVTNEEMEELYNRTPVGIPIEIIP